MEIDYGDFSSKQTLQEININRRKSTRTILSGSVIEMSPEHLLIHLILNDEIWINCPKVIFDAKIEQISKRFGIKKKDITERINYLYNDRLYYDNLEELSCLIKAPPEYLPNSPLSHLEFIASDVLNNSEIANIIRSSDLYLNTIIPESTSLQYLSAVWKPLALRTSLVLDKAETLNANYYSPDPFEVDLHGKLYSEGLNQSRNIKNNLINSIVKPNFDHRPFLFFLAFSLLFEGKNKMASSKKDLTNLFRKPKEAKAISNRFNLIADRFYSAPFIISSSEFHYELKEELFDMVSGFHFNPMMSAIIGGLSQIPLPLGIPNPLSLFMSIKDFVEKHKVNKEFGWLLYLINIFKGTNHFSIKTSPQIPSLLHLNFKDDDIYTTTQSLLVLNKKTRILHSSNCNHLSKTSKESVKIFFQGATKLQEYDFELCRDCLKPILDARIKLYERVRRKKASYYSEREHNPYLERENTALNEIKKVKEHKSKRLDLGNFGLDYIPTEVFEMNWINTLILGYMDDHLSVNNSPIEIIPDEIGLLTNLENLNLENNAITFLPKSIRKLTNLKFINLHANSLKELPSEIKYLKKIEVIYLGLNNIKKLPDHITELNNLKHLGLSNNKLTTLPSELGSLKSLKYLDISRNRITHLPKSIIELENLETLILNNNPLESPPIDIASQGIDAIRKWFEQET